MVDEKRKSWFRRHWIITTILVILILLIIIGAFSSNPEKNNGSTGNVIKDSESSEKEIISTGSNLLLPQDSEIDRIWVISDIQSINESATGFIEGSKRKMNKVENIEASSVITMVYRFDSLNNANQFYDQEKQKVDKRGVEEWNLGKDCFGIEKDNLISGYAKGVCSRDNIVFYVESVSGSTSYASYGKDFMEIMLKKV